LIGSSSRLHQEESGKSHTWAILAQRFLDTFGSSPLANSTTPRCMPLSLESESRKGSGSHLAKTPSTNIGCDEWREGLRVKWLEELIRSLPLCHLRSLIRQMGKPGFVDDPLTKYVALEVLLYFCMQSVGV
jgi:hypothetical protein